MILLKKYIYIWPQKKLLCYQVCQENCPNNYLLCLVGSAISLRITLIYVLERHIYIL